MIGCSDMVQEAIAHASPTKPNKRGPGPELDPSFFNPIRSYQSFDFRFSNTNRVWQLLPALLQISSCTPSLSETTVLPL